MTKHGQLMWLGTGVDYVAAQVLQRRIAAERAVGAIQDTLLLLEHAPVYTEGRRATAQHVLRELAAPLVKTDRGGQTTYHGPGQLVGYPIVSLAELGLGPRRYLAALEQGIVDALFALGVRAWREEGTTAVWTDYGKVAALGVKVSRGVTLHGFALNVTTDLSNFESIVPCGIVNRPVASIASSLTAAPRTGEVRCHVAEALGRRLGIIWKETLAPQQTPLGIIHAQ